jgi:hypothetical protein
MREATIDPGRFSSPPDGNFRMNLIAPGRDEQAIAVPVVRNRHGLSLVEWRGDVAGVTQITLRPAEVFTLVRLDLIEVFDEVVRTDPVLLFRWSGESGRQLLPTDGVHWVASHVMAVDGTSTITIDLPTPVVSRELRIAVAGAFLPVSPDPGEAPEINELEAEIASLRKEIDSIYRTKIFRFAALPRRVYGAIRKR